MLDKKEEKKYIKLEVWIPLLAKNSPSVLQRLKFTQNQVRHAIQHYFGYSIGSVRVDIAEQGIDGIAYGPF